MKKPANSREKGGSNSLRPAFKNSELGPIPADWEVRAIGEMACVCTGNSNTQDKVDTGKYPFYVRSPIVEHINEYGFDTEGVVTVGDGVGTGKVFHYVNGKFALHQRCYLIDQFCPLLNSKYFFTIFSSRFYERVMQMTAKSSVDSVRREMITGMLIPVPPLSEQRRIAAALTDADAWIESLDKLIEKKKLVKQGAMQTLLSGKTRLSGFGVVGVKMSEVGSIPVDWEVKRLGEIARILDNRRVPLNDAQRRKGCYPYCGANGIVDYIDRYEFDEETVLIAEDGGNFSDFATRPIAYKMSGKYWVNNHAHVLTANAGYDLDYLFWQLVHKDITDFVTGGTREKLTRGQLETICVPAPSLKEQKAIAAVLSDMDAELAALSREKVKAEQIKQGMMQELLTGKTRLKGE